jgi:hypothetical protein
MGRRRRRTVEVQLASERISLPLPAGPAAVRVLRGEGFRRVAPVVRPNVAPTGASMRFPSFPGAARRLIGRGDDEHEVVSVTIPELRGLGAGTGRPHRRHRFPGIVLAAGTIGTRLVVLHALDELIEVR